MTQPLFPHDTGDNILTRIYEGMHVYDHDGNKVGTVKEVYLGAVTKTADERGLWLVLLFAYIAAPMDGSGEVSKEYPQAPSIRPRLRDTTQTARGKSRNNIRSQQVRGQKKLDEHKTEIKLLLGLRDDCLMIV